MSSSKRRRRRRRWRRWRRRLSQQLRILPARPTLPALPLTIIDRNRWISIFNNTFYWDYLTIRDIYVDRSSKWRRRKNRRNRKSRKSRKERNRKRKSTWANPLHSIGHRRPVKAKKSGWNLSSCDATAPTSPSRHCIPSSIASIREKHSEIIKKSSKNSEFCIKSIHRNPQKIPFRNPQKSSKMLQKILKKILKKFWIFHQINS